MFFSSKICDALSPNNWSLYLPFVLVPIFAIKLIFFILSHFTGAHFHITPVVIYNLVQGSRWRKFISNTLFMDYNCFADSINTDFFTSRDYCYSVTSQYNTDVFIWRKIIILESPTPLFLWFSLMLLSTLMWWSVSGQTRTTECLQ